MFETLTISLAVGFVAFIVVALFNSQYRNIMQGLLVIGSVGLVIAFLYSLVEFSDSTSKTNNYSSNTQAIDKPKTGCIWGNCNYGTGEYIFTNGDKYIGEWRDGSFDGKGTLTWSFGDQYSGEWKDGSRTGLGTYTWANGKQYSGKWKDGIRDGEGTYTSADKTKRWPAKFENGEDHCQGNFLERLNHGCF